MPKAKVTEKEVRAVLIEKGYELPNLKSPKQRREFKEEHGYDPRIVINSTMAMAATFRNWKDRVQPLNIGP